MSFDFSGKTAIVTGAAHGFGRAISLAFAERGASVWACDVVDDEVRETERLGSTAGLTCLARIVDVTDKRAVNALASDACAATGRVDILVNNAGVTRDGLSMRMSMEDWDTVMNTNLKGAFNFIQAVMRPMIKQRSGRIINISSIAGLIGNAGQANYAASKAGLIGLTKTLARELASRGITVNAVAPGLIETDMTTVLSEEIRQNILKNVPLGKLGEPEDIAGAVAYLASAEAKYITGQVLTVDGGMVM
jgi:3-oxoacyl-[acyl-carrier protein] reductase